MVPCHFSSTQDNFLLFLLPNKGRKGETVKCLETHLRKDRSGSFILRSLQNAKPLIAMSARFLWTCFIVPRVIVKFHWASSNCPDQGEGPPVWQCQVFLMAGMPWVYCVMHPENHLVLWNQEQVKAPWLTAMHDSLVFHSLTLDFLSCDFRQEGHFALSPSFTFLRPESRLKMTVRTHFHKCSFDARQKICKPADCVIK